MAKNYQLIPGFDDNWEVALFMLINHVHPEIGVGHRWHRASMCNSSTSINFIQNFLSVALYSTEKTPSESISSAITSAEQKKHYIKCIHGECYLTKAGYDRLREVVQTYNPKTIKPIGKLAKVKSMLSKLTDQQRRELLENGVDYDKTYS